jgi:hypothetical protein
MSDNSLNSFVESLYDVTNLPIEELKMWYDSYSYKGFDKTKVLIHLMKKVGDPKVCQQIILVCGLLGPQRASQAKLLNGKLINSYGIPASGAKGTDEISCQRIVAATADLCAYFLKRLNVPKRMNVECPSWLQFPGAGSIQLPSNLRQQHIEFAKKFSVAIGGVFNESIYAQMEANAYLDPKLGLFDNALPNLNLIRDPTTMPLPQLESKVGGKKKPP